MPRIDGPPIEAVNRFWAKVSLDGPIHSVCGQCWIWTDTLWGNDRYAQIRICGDRILVHRLSWWIHHGRIPEGLYVLHHCDNPICVNPDHLFLGTHADNMVDKARKGRAPSLTGGRNGSYTKPECRPKGERHGGHVLTEEDVISIRERYIPRHSKHGTNAIARELGMSQYAIWAIVTRKNWRHIA